MVEEGRNSEGLSLPAAVSHQARKALHCTAHKSCVMAAVDTNSDVFYLELVRVELYVIQRLHGEAHCGVCLFYTCGWFAASRIGLLCA